ncbi:MAG: penicillin-binding protein 2 [Chloroflexi bacterium]|nr:penicillin-binding protein 2 [Chloroflexota bacterium]
MSVRKAQQQVTPRDREARVGAIRNAPRVIVLGMLILGVFVVFSLRLWNLQFVQGETYQRLAERQSTRPITVPAARGIIYDSNGTPLVRNFPSFNVAVVPAYLPPGDSDVIEIASDEAEQVLIRLAVLLNMPYTTEGSRTDLDNPLLGVRDILRNTLRDVNGDEVPFTNYYRPVVIKRGVHRDEALLVSQQALLLPGVLVELESARDYPYGSLVSQILGYLLPIPEEGVEEYRAQGYEPATDRIGRAGIEATYEDNLRGQKGQQIVEEDVLGQISRIVAELAEPVPGDNVYLTIDLELQQFVQETLQAKMEEPSVNSPRGAAIVMNPQTGEILSMVSLPTYDNNLFTHGISALDWEVLASNPHRPTLNHAISDLLPPGSIFKIVVSTGALREGVLNGQYTNLSCPGKIEILEKFALNDPGYARPFYCWNKSGHGLLDVVGGIAHSCDVFFYKAGGGFEEIDFEGLGVSRIAQYARMFGLGEQTGVELPFEVEGLVPTADWKRLTYRESWSIGDTYNLSIGQGFLTVTPLQMLNVANVIANGGTLYRTRIVHHVTDAAGNVIQPFEPEIMSTVPISQEHLSLVRQGMEAAVAYGTSQRTQIEGLRVSGKTGTAQFCDDLMCGVGYQQPEHAWFMAYASREDVQEPEVSVLVFLYNGGEGSVASVPVARDILTYYFGLDEIDEVEEPTS